MADSKLPDDVENAVLIVCISANISAIMSQVLFLFMALCVSKRQRYAANLVLGERISA